MNTIILDHTKKDYSPIIKEIIPVLKTGGVVVLPTDTVYAYVADATNQKAVDTLLGLKKMPIGKPLSVFIGSMELAESYVEITPQQKIVLSSLLPGSYTCILPSKKELAKGVVSDKKTLGTRIPIHPWINELVMEYGSPLTATAASNAGDSPHYSGGSFLKSISKKSQSLINLLVDDGDLPRRDPSTVIDMSTIDPIMLRAGEGEVLYSGISKSEEETQAYAQTILDIVGDLVKRKPVVILLEGNFGVGKTVLVKAIAEKLGVDGVVSPTFAIYYDYDVRKKDAAIKKLYHFDLFRIEDAVEYEELEIETLLNPGSLFCIEWAQKSTEFLQHISGRSHVILVHMERIDDTSRKIEIRRLHI
jgi:tRNA threonylcarbamoyl adenosine modification protein (Sua5/YciO/YrdC/YwlC family)/tRNA threonylcarbamoyl adenosine modification protein YjeE